MKALLIIGGILLLLVLLSLVRVGAVLSFGEELRVRLRLRPAAFGPYRQNMARAPPLCAVPAGRRGRSWASARRAAGQRACRIWRIPPCGPPFWRTQGTAHCCPAARGTVPRIGCTPAQQRPAWFFGCSSVFPPAQAVAAHVTAYFVPACGAGVVHGGRPPGGCVPLVKLGAESAVCRALRVTARLPVGAMVTGHGHGVFLSLQNSSRT